MVDNNNARQQLLDEMKTRLCDIEKYYELGESGNDEEAATYQETLLENVLEVSERQEIKILLSWGGPSDGFLLYKDTHTGDVLGGKYFFADWGTYEEAMLSEHEAEMVAELYGV